MGRLHVYDPRQSHQRFVSRVVTFFFSTGEVGGIAFLAACLPIVLPTAWLARRAFNLNIGDTLFMLAVVVMIIVAGLHTHLVMSRRRHLKQVDHRACLWCHHPLTEEIERGVCPECGLGYEARVNERLISMTLSPQRPTGRVFIRRAALLWARAVVRGRDQGSGTRDPGLDG